MTEYRFHGWSSRPQPTATRITLSAESKLHGAALALQHFAQLGCDITAPLAHVDVTEPDGAKRTLLVEEVLDWLSDPNQAAFVHDKDLAALLH
jgi:hypothetical protein